jgi:hypothetical protein
MIIHDAVDYTGTGAPATLASIFGLTENAQAKWFQVSDVSVGSTAARVGGPLVSATRGIPIKADGGQFAPPVAEFTSLYDLARIYLLVQIGETVSVCYAL